MLYMVIEKYRHGWVVDDDRLDRCFQLMETDNRELFGIWQEQWSDLTEFEIVPVIKSAEAASRVEVR